MESTLTESSAGVANSSARSTSPSSNSLRASCRRCDAPMTRSRIATLIGRCFGACLFRRFVERFEKLFAEFSIAFCNQTQDFAAQVGPAADYDWTAFALESLHLLGAFLCGLGVDDLSGFPGAPEELASTFRDRCPKARRPLVPARVRGASDP